MSVFNPTATVRSSDTRTTTRRIVAVVSAPVAAGALWAVEVPLLGARLGVRFPHGGAQVIAGGPVVGASLVAALAGWALVALIATRSGHGRRLWTTVAVAVLAVSLILPLASAITAVAAICLIGLHLAVGAAVIPQMRATMGGSGRSSHHEAGGDLDL
jgi:hypothetical protein